jgi:hypothetical protein
MMVDALMPTDLNRWFSTVEMPRMNAMEVKVAISNSILLIIIQIHKDDSIVIISDYMRNHLSILFSV